MTQEQMNALAIKWANKNKDNYFQLTGTLLSERDYSRVKFDYFQGLKKANEVWEEKTRWIPVTERLPEVREGEYLVVLKNEKNNQYKLITIEKDRLRAYFVATHWREIE